MFILINREFKVIVIVIVYVKDSKKCICMHKYAFACICIKCYLLLTLATIHTTDNNRQMQKNQVQKCVNDADMPALVSLCALVMSSVDDCATESDKTSCVACLSSFSICMVTESDAWQLMAITFSYIVSPVSSLRFHSRNVIV